MKASEFPTQDEYQFAMNAAVPVLADSYCIRASYTSDGFVQGPLWPQGMDPGASLRRQVLKSSPATGWPHF